MGTVIFRELKRFAIVTLAWSSVVAIFVLLLMTFAHVEIAPNWEIVFRQIYSYDPFSILTLLCPYLVWKVDSVARWLASRMKVSLFGSRFVLTAVGIGAICISLHVSYLADQKILMGFLHYEFHGFGSEKHPDPEIERRRQKRWICFLHVWSPWWRLGTPSNALLNELNRRYGSPKIFFREGSRGKIGEYTSDGTITYPAVADTLTGERGFIFSIEGVQRIGLFRAIVYRSSWASLGDHLHGARVGNLKEGRWNFDYVEDE